jgi:hypothetical protein
MPKSSKHLDNEKKATVASGESKKTGLMDGIVGGLPRHVSPPIVDGIVRGISRGMGSNAMQGVAASATKNTKGAFGAGNYAEGKM